MDLYQIFITHNRLWSVRETIIFFLLLFLIVGLLLRQLKYGKLEKTQFFAVIALYVFVSIVFGSTVFTRTSGKRMYELIPFWSWRKVIFEHDFMLLEENLLNMLLFVPIGGLLELCLKRIKWKQAASIGLGISVVIELSQLILCRGWFEWDDMIHNTLGCVCGYLIVKKLYVLKRKMADY